MGGLGVEEQSSDDRRRMKSGGERHGEWQSQRRKPSELGRYTERTQSSPYACQFSHKPHRRGEKRSWRMKEVEEESEQVREDDH